MLSTSYQQDDDIVNKLMRTYHTKIFYISYETSFAMNVRRILINRTLEDMKRFLQHDTTQPTDRRLLQDREGEDITRLQGQYNK